jgi:hypothetical protein
MDQEGRLSASTHPLETSEEGIFPELIKGSGLQRLIRSEVEQAKREAVGVARQARPHVAKIVAGAALTVMGLGFLSLTGMFALEIVLPNWLAALIVCVLVLGIGKLLGSRGQRGLRRTVQTAKLEWPE